MREEGDFISDFPIFLLPGMEKCTFRRKKIEVKIGVGGDTKWEEGEENAQLSNRTTTTVRLLKVQFESNLEFSMHGQKIKGLELRKGCASKKDSKKCLSQSIGYPVVLPIPPAKKTTRGKRYGTVLYK